MEFDFLHPLSDDIIEHIQSLSSQNLGSKVVLHSKSDFPDINKVQLAIIGVLENRGDSNQINDVDLTAIRKEFYSLYPGNWQASIADLGDIKAGEELSDTYFALKSVVGTLIKKRIVPIIIGGSQDLTYAMYRSYDTLEQMVNLVSIDSKFDLGKENATDMALSYLTRIILEEPNNLFNYSVVGYQTYNNAQEEIDLMEKLFFDGYRLGEVSSNIKVSEPVFRDADIVTLDLTSIQSSSSGNFATFVPNGFNGKEICSLARYSGLSDKLSLFGIFNHNNSKSEAVLIAQILWYFIEGFECRSNEYPFTSKEDYIKYIVPLEMEELVFYKSNKSDRWWIEVPQIINRHTKTEKNSLLPCSYEDYLGAINQEIPERWWKTQRKNII
ncbi:formimidoylglutamase [Flavobacterium sp.]|uniref:formimidoylglutamase n=1 Tax=Flavobacterium sp. TaxID=239 RepID=UPI002612D178|nr:formimidoylglutamase [Flavobacterium sp.]MDD3004981.1 formimidoylglutamase [Flavobacterium sp.]